MSLVVQTPLRSANNLGTIGQPMGEERNSLPFFPLPQKSKLKGLLSYSGE